MAYTNDLAFVVELCFQIIINKWAKNNSEDSNLENLLIEKRHQEKPVYWWRQGLRQEQMQLAGIL